MKSADEFKSEWYSNWHKIDPDKSNYIDMHRYCEIQDVIAIAAESRTNEAKAAL